MNRVNSKLTPLPGKVSWERGAEERKDRFRDLERAISSAFFRFMRMTVC